LKRHALQQISPCPSFLKRGITSLSQREARRDLVFDVQTIMDRLVNAPFVHGEFWDVVCSRRKLNRESGLRWMEKNEAMITTTEIIAFQLLKEVETDEFKRLSISSSMKGGFA